MVGDPSSDLTSSSRLYRRGRQCDSMPCHHLPAPDAHRFQLLRQKPRRSRFGNFAHVVPVSCYQGTRPIPLAPRGMFLPVRNPPERYILRCICLVNHPDCCWSLQSNCSGGSSQARFSHIQVGAPDGGRCLDSVVLNHFSAIVYCHGFHRLPARFQHDWLYSKMAEHRRWRRDAANLLHRHDHFSCMFYRLPLSLARSVVFLGSFVPAVSSTSLWEKSTVRLTSKDFEKGCVNDKTTKPKSF